MIKRDLGSTLNFNISLLSFAFLNNISALPRRLMIDIFSPANGKSK
jgi:hypothetical protein